MPNNPSLPIETLPAFDPDEARAEAVRLVTSGEADSPLSACRMAGLNLTAREARALFRKADMAEAMRQERRRVISTELVPAALAALGEVLGDPSQKAGDRVKAAGIVLEHARKGDEEAAKAPEKAPSEMTLAELEAYVASAAGRLQDVTKSASIPDQSGRGAFVNH